MNETSNPVTWITGASSGIGRELTRQLAQNGGNVAVSARSTEKLEALVAESEAWPGEVRAFPSDITDREGVEKTVAAIEDSFGPINLAILNAGTYIAEIATRFDAEKFARQVDVNLVGTANCFAAVMEPMLERRDGHIVPVASMSGYRGLPQAAGYGATKAALINFAEAMHPALAPSGITVQVCCPGFVKTPLTERNRFDMPFLMDVDKAAAAFIRGLGSSSFEISFPKRLGWLLKFAGAMPDWLYFKLTSTLVRTEKDGLPTK